MKEPQIENMRAQATSYWKTFEMCRVEEFKKKKWDEAKRFRCELYEKTRLYNKEKWTSFWQAYRKCFKASLSLRLHRKLWAKELEEREKFQIKMREYLQKKSKARIKKATSFNHKDFHRITACGVEPTIKKDTREKELLNMCTSYFSEFNELFKDFLDEQRNKKPRAIRGDLKVLPSQMYCNTYHHCGSNPSCEVTVLKSNCNNTVLKGKLEASKKVVNPAKLKSKGTKISSRMPQNLQHTEMSNDKKVLGQSDDAIHQQTPTKKDDLVDKATTTYPDIPTIYVYESNKKSIRPDSESRNQTHPKISSKLAKFRELRELSNSIPGSTFVDTSNNHVNNTLLNNSNPLNSSNNSNNVSHKIITSKYIIKQESLGNNGKEGTCKELITNNKYRSPQSLKPSSSTLLPGKHFAKMNSKFNVSEVKMSENKQCDNSHKKKELNSPKRVVNNYRMAQNKIPGRTNEAKGNVKGNLKTQLVSQKKKDHKIKIIQDSSELNKTKKTKLIVDPIKLEKFKSEKLTRNPTKIAKIENNNFVENSRKLKSVINEKLAQNKKLRKIIPDEQIGFIGPKSCLWPEMGPPEDLRNSPRIVGKLNVYKPTLWKTQLEKKTDSVKNSDYFSDAHTKHLGFNHSKPLIPSSLSQSLEPVNRKLSRNSKMPFGNISNPTSNNSRSECLNTSTTIYRSDGCREEQFCPMNYSHIWPRCNKFNNLRNYNYPIGPYTIRESSCSGDDNESILCGSNFLYIDKNKEVSSNPKGDISASDKNSEVDFKAKQPNMKSFNYCDCRFFNENKIKSSDIEDSELDASDKIYSETDTSTRLKCSELVKQFFAI